MRWGGPPRSYGATNEAESPPCASAVPVAIVQPTSVNPDPLTRLPSIVCHTTSTGGARGGAPRPPGRAGPGGRPPPPAPAGAGPPRPGAGGPAGGGVAAEGRRETGWNTPCRCSV